MENRSQLILKAAMRYGLILGPSIVLANIIFYAFFDLSQFSLSAIMGLMFLFSFLPYVMGVYLCMKSARNKVLGGLMSYGEGLRFGTTLMLFAGVILAGYSLVFNNWVAPNYVEQTQEIIIEKTVEYYERIGMSAADIDKAITLLDSQKVEKTEQSRLVAPLMSIPMSAFVGFLISLVAAAILKRKGDPFQSAMQNIE